MSHIKLSFEKLIIKIENPATPGQFKAPCGLTSKGIKRSKDMTETTILKCEDEGAMVAKESRPNSYQVEVSGEGALHMDDLALWRAFFDSSEPWRCQVIRNRSRAEGGGYDEGYFNLTTFDETVEWTNHTTFSITLVSSGEITWTDAA
jgi:predicted secreted protein